MTHKFMVLLIFGLLLVLFWYMKSNTSNPEQDTGKPKESNKYEYGGNTYDTYSSGKCNHCFGSGDIYMCSNWASDWHKSDKLTWLSSDHHEDMFCSECREKKIKYEIIEMDCFNCSGTGKYSPEY